MSGLSAAAATISGGRLYVLLPESQAPLYTQLHAGFTTEDVRRAIEALVPKTTQRLMWIAHDEPVLYLPSTGSPGIVNTRSLADALPMVVTRCTVFDAVNAYLGREKSWLTTDTAVVMVENCPNGNGGQLVYYVDRGAYAASGIRAVPQKQWLTTAPEVVGDAISKITGDHPSLKHVTVMSVTGLTAIRYGGGSAFWQPFHARATSTKLMVHVWINGADIFRGASLLAQLPAAA